MGMCYGWHKPSAHPGFCNRRSMAQSSDRQLPHTELLQCQRFSLCFCQEGDLSTPGMFLADVDVFLTDSKMIKMIVDLLLAAWMLIILCMILHPNRMIHSAEVKRENGKSRKRKAFNWYRKKPKKLKIRSSQRTWSRVKKEHLVKTERQIQPEEWDTVEQEVLTIVSRRYLEPSLKRVEVIGDVRKSTHSLAGKFFHRNRILPIGKCLPHPPLRATDTRCACSYEPRNRRREMCLQESLGISNAPGKRIERFRLFAYREMIYGSDSSVVHYCKMAESFPTLLKFLPFSFG